jgi:hypothetical protein
VTRHPGEQVARETTAAVACPTCHKPPGEPCFPEVLGYLPAPHHSRWRAYTATLDDNYFRQLGEQAIEAREP